MNKNPFAPEVPCHRVVKSNGELGGFADDIAVKIKRYIEMNALIKLKSGEEFNTHFHDFSPVSFKDLPKKWDYLSNSQKKILHTLGLFLRLMSANDFSLYIVQHTHLSTGVFLLSECET
jgi:hypothetical protein